ncbi:MAG: hypothetical protein QM820_05905 [Minicystis sp.]
MIRTSGSLLLSVLLVLSGCGKSGPDMLAEGAALEAQGKLEEAAAKLDLACAFAPKNPGCAAADGRAAEARIKAAEKAVAEGKFRAAERLFVLALATADEAIARRANDRLTSNDLQQALAYERALTLPDKKDGAGAMEKIAATKAPVAAQAKAWLDRERPGLLVAAAQAACGPAHEGSCSKAAADLRAAAVTGPEAEAAIALAEEEERRVYPLRVNAEVFLQNLDAAAKTEALAEGCKLPRDIMGGAANVPGLWADCRNSGLFASYVMPPQEVEEQIRKRRVNDAVWRKAMKAIGDPEIVAALEARRGKDYKRQDIPKPRPAPKGGKK